MATVVYCQSDNLARGACQTLGVCWGHDCVGFADCPCQKCRHQRVTATERHAEHQTPDLNYCGTCRTIERERWRTT